MDKITKALAKLSSKEKQILKILLSKLNNGETEGLDIKKLKDHNDIFRAKKAKIRIIYRLDNQNNIYLLTTERRNDHTYNF